MYLLRSLLVISMILQPGFSTVSVRLKDIVSVEGVRNNQLVGYGLVVGLNGTGDNVASVPFTKESLASMLERLGVNVRDNQGKVTLSGKNVAAVMVTANLPAFARQGSRIDVNVSALGDAKDLRGGTLLVTPLLAADSQVYAVAQGPVAISGFSAQGASGSSVVKGVPTSGRIASGAIVEKEVDFELGRLNTLKLSLNNPDFTTAKRASDRINQKIGTDVAQALDPSTILMTLPERYKGHPVEFMTTIEQLTIEPDNIAKIVVDNSNGVVVMGSHVRISKVAITHGSITIRVSETPEVSQPNPFMMSNAYGLTANQGLQNQSPITVNLTPPAAGNAANPAAVTTNTLNNITAAQNPALNIPQTQGQPTRLGRAGVIAPGPGTAIVNRSDVKVKEEKGKIAVLEEGATLQELVDGLNALGTSPTELVSILEAIKAAGALQADIDVI